MTYFCMLMTLKKHSGTRQKKIVLGCDTVLPSDTVSQPNRLDSSFYTLLL